MLKRFTLFVLLALVCIPSGGTFSNRSPKVQAQDGEFVFGLIMVGPHDDNGWSEAHYEAGLYIDDFSALLSDDLGDGVRMVWVDRFNAVDSPELTLEEVVEDMISQGARLIIANSDDMKDEVTAIAASYPDVVFIHISGDGVLTGEAPENLGNIMGRMEYGKMIAGCAAALKTQTGKIAYMGALVNHETTRLASSAFLGARYCYEQRGMEAELEFEVVWIGFWFHIEGVTLDPTEVVNDFYDNGADVVISGIDTTQAIDVAGQRVDKGEAVWAIPYDYVDACTNSREACLGVPYFNWGPAYIDTIEAVVKDEWEPRWDWNHPDWESINNLDTTAVGFIIGDALGEEESAALDEFIDRLGAGATGEEDGLNLFTGPLNYQDGSVFLAEGEVATDEQIWYLEQLLEGMTVLTETE